MRTTFEKVPLLMFCAAAAALLMLACEPRTPPTAPTEKPEAPAPAAEAPAFELTGDAEAGQGIYVAQCATCHGLEGEGDGPAAAALDPSPAALAQTELTPAQIYGVIRDGGMSAGLAATMPAFGAQLSEQQLQDVTAFVVGLSP